MEDPFIARIALALNDEHRNICPGKGAEVIQPVGKRATLKSQVAFGVASLFKFRHPEKEKNGLPLKK